MEIKDFASKKKTRKKGFKKFPILASDLKPGRHECLCEAVNHVLVNNCLTCGRIVCEQEGSGPCFTCNALVCTPDELDLINREGRKGIELYEKLMGGISYQDFPVRNKGSGLAFEKAVKHKEKLLESDKSLATCTKVFDDECDYGSDSDKWLTFAQREALSKHEDELYEARHGSRLNRKLTLSIMGKHVFEQKKPSMPNLTKILDIDYSDVKCQSESPTDVINAFDLNFDESWNIRCPPNPRSDFPTTKRKNRIQDPELKTMSDDGMCLTVHQPYASLLVAGIKRHEGRYWYTSHRGRLWIHAADKSPNVEEICAVENAYFNLTGITDMPKRYPTGCVLGCVDIVNCLIQNEYREEYPSGEIASPYVFICENARELCIKVPMKGKMHIFKLSEPFHKTVKKILSGIQ